MFKLDSMKKILLFSLLIFLCQTGPLFAQTIPLQVKLGRFRRILKPIESKFEIKVPFAFLREEEKNELDEKSPLVLQWPSGSMKLTPQTFLKKPFFEALDFKDPILEDFKEEIASLDPENSSWASEKESDEKTRVLSPTLLWDSKNQRVFIPLTSSLGDRLALFHLFSVELPSRRIRHLLTYGYPGRFSDFFLSPDRRSISVSFHERGDWGITPELLFLRTDSIHQTPLKLGVFFRKEQKAAHRFLEQWFRRHPFPRREDLGKNSQAVLGENWIFRHFTSPSHAKVCYQRSEIEENEEFYDGKHVTQIDRGRCYQLDLARRTLLDLGEYEKIKKEKRM